MLTIMGTTQGCTDNCWGRNWLAFESMLMALPQSTVSWPVAPPLTVTAEMSFANMFQLTWNILNPSEEPPFSIYSILQPSVCSSSCSFIWNQQKSWGWRNIRIYDHSWFHHPPPWHFTSAQLRPWLVQAPTIAATKASAVWAMHWWPCWSRRRLVEYQSYGWR